jgi:hypothetical protein
LLADNDGHFHLLPAALWAASFVGDFSAQTRKATAMSKEQIVWKKNAEGEDYAGAQRFLALIFADAKAKKLLAALHKAENVEYATKDLLRASHLPLLPRDEPHVDEDLKRIHKSQPLAPLLLIRGDMSKGIPLIVADGYHRICAICYFDESASIPCRVVSADNSVTR